MSTTTAAILEPGMLEIVNTTLDKQFEEKVLLINKFPKGEGINTLGKRVPVYLRPSASFTWFTEGGSHAVPGTPTYLSTRAYPVRCSAGFEFTGTALRELKTPEAKIKDLTKNLSDAQSTAMKKMEQAVTGSYTGEVATVYSYDSSTQMTMATTYAQGSLFSNRKLLPAGRYQTYSSSGTQRTGGMTTPYVSTVSTTTAPVRSTGVTTFDLAPSDAVATDIVVYQGSYGNAVTGLKDLISNSGSIQGQSRTTYPELKSGYDDASGAAISPARLRKNVNAIKFRTEQNPANISFLSSPVQKEAYENQGYNLVRTQGGGTLRLDYDDVKFGRHTWDESTDIDDDRLYGADYSKFAKDDLKPFGRFNEDGQDWRLYFSNGAASDKFTGWIGWEGQLSCEHFNCNFLIVNLATTGFATGLTSVN